MPWVSASDDRPASIGRREFLKASVMGAVGLSLPQLLSLQAQAKQQGRAARAKNVLVILEQGGVSHLDTFDPKPLLPAEHRSPFKPIATNVPGIQFTELLTHTARHADKLVLLRSMNHGVSDHGAGTAYMLQGHPMGGPIKHPDMGCVVSQKLGSACRWLPPYIMVPGNHEQTGVTTTGFLSPSLAAFKTGGSDLSDPRWTVPNLRATQEVASRLGDRRQMLRQIDEGRRAFLEQDAPAGLSKFYEQAFDTLDNPKVSAAFDLKCEPDVLRQKYGRGHRGACYLLGRRLIEAGVRFVTVDTRWPLTEETPGGFNLNWDHHDFIYAKGSCGTIRDKAGGEGRYGIAHWCMMGSTDVALAALLEDMDQRGLLKDTLVAFVTEFGRTPKLNKFQGRDHWTSAYTIALAGAGIRGGQVIGASDREGGQVKDRPLGPPDYAATVYHFLGIDPTLDRVMTRDNRPIDLTAGGEVIRELI